MASAEEAARKAGMEAADQARKAGASPQEVKEAYKKAAEKTLFAKQSAAVHACKTAAEHARSAGESIQQASQACSQAVLKLATVAGLNKEQAAQLAASMAKAEAGVLAKKAGMSPAEIRQEMQQASDKVLDSSSGITSVIAGRLNCSTPGCTAWSRLHVDPAIARLGGTCKMSVNVTQTDFDESVGVPEVIEFIALEGAGNLTANVKPGRNPCTEEYSSGKAVPFQERAFPVITDLDVTQYILKAHLGKLVLSGKISQHVDECGSNGSLLDGYVNILCTMSKHASTMNSAVNTTASNQSNDTSSEIAKSNADTAPDPDGADGHAFGPVDLIMAAIESSTG